MMDIQPLQPLQPRKFLMYTFTHTTLVKLAEYGVVIVITIVGWAFAFGLVMSRINELTHTVEEMRPELKKAVADISYIRGMMDRGKRYGMSDEEATLAAAVVDILPSLPGEFDLHDVAKELAVRYPDSTATMSAISVTLSRMREDGLLEVRSRFTRPYKYALVTKP